MIERGSIERDCDTEWLQWRGGAALWLDVAVDDGVLVAPLDRIHELVYVQAYDLLVCWHRDGAARNAA